MAKGPCWLEYDLENGSPACCGLGTIPPFSLLPLQAFLCSWESVGSWRRMHQPLVWHLILWNVFFKTYIPSTNIKGGSGHDGC